MVDIFEEKIQGGNALGKSALDLPPLLVRDDARKQIIGKYALRALVVAVDGERNPLMQKREVGGLLALAQFFGRKFQQSLEKCPVVVSRHARRGEHLVVGGVELIIAKWGTK